MKKEQVHTLANNHRLPGNFEDPKIISTHISWVILGKKYAYKIKRPVKFSFADFSSLEKRKTFCNKEVELNSRLAPDMYLKVLPITKNMLDEGNGEEKIIDYAVQMKRMDNSKEMANLLEKDEVTEQHIVKLAEKIADFHRKAQIVKNVFNTTEFHENFAKIENEYPLIEKELGKEWVKKINESIEKSHVYLNASRNFINQRIILGYRKDCHGDLSAHNIFLYDDPVIFDCIEFNKEFRQIDILNEVAFLCTDLDFYEKQNLSDIFYNKYLELMGFTENEDDRKLFNYYKAYRANVRAKVTLLNVKQNPENKRDDKIFDEVKRYLDLMSGYMKNL